MANLTPKLLYIGNGNGSNVYTSNSSANSYAIIKNINVCNTTANNTSVSMHLLTPGQVPSANNAILANIIITGTNVTFYNTSIVIPSNSSIYLTQLASNTATVTISGVEYIG